MNYSPSDIAEAELAAIPGSRRYVDAAARAITGPLRCAPFETVYYAAFSAAEAIDPHLPEHRNGRMGPLHDALAHKSALLVASKVTGSQLDDEIVFEHYGHEWRFLNYYSHGWRSWGYYGDPWRCYLEYLGPRALHSFRALAITTGCPHNCVVGDVVSVPKSPGLLIVTVPRAPGWPAVSPSKNYNQVSVPLVPHETYEAICRHLDSDLWAGSELLSLIDRGVRATHRHNWENDDRRWNLL